MAAERVRKARRKRERVRVQDGAYGRELIVDETFASLYRPGHIATGCVWDGIAAPLLGLPPERRRSVLVLGLAGGSAARIARALAPDALIVGVELDAEVVAVARDAFDLDALGLELIVDDALAVLKRERRRFDAILEDVFIGRGDAVRKPSWVPEPAHRLAARRLRPGGILVSNTLDEAAVVGRALTAAHEAVVRIEIETTTTASSPPGPQDSVRAAFAQRSRAVRFSPSRSPSCALEAGTARNASDCRAAFRWARRHAV